MFEWHPFTISSAPEMSSSISLHIRVVGHWTSKLYEYFEQEQKRLQCTMEGGVCQVRESGKMNTVTKNAGDTLHVIQEPETKLERLQKTVNIAKERVRKTSVTILGGQQPNADAAAAAAAAARRQSRKESVHQQFQTAAGAAGISAGDAAAALSDGGGGEDNNNYVVSEVEVHEPQQHPGKRLDEPLKDG